MFNPFRKPSDFGFDVNQLALGMSEDGKLELASRQIKACERRDLLVVLVVLIVIGVTAYFAAVGLPFKLPWNFW